MTNEKFIIYEDRQYLKNRLDELRAFFDTSLAKGLSSDVIEGLFTFLLTKQSPDGSWRDAEGKWTGVQTAVTLKALARLGYKSSSTWPIVQGDRRQRGGVDRALSFFNKERDKIHPKEVPNGLIEDIWDTCQVLLAFASYGRPDELRNVVSYLESNWLQLYEEYLASDKHDWSGPAFLAAMLDVFVSCNSPHTLKQAVLEHLMNIGKDGGQDYSGFLWGQSRAEPCWHAALVLRTLSQLPESLLSRKAKTDVLEKFVPSLLSERGADAQGHVHPFWGTGRSIERFRSMHTARAMEGLVFALPYLSEALADDVIRAIDIGNQYLASESKPDEEQHFPGVMIDTLKSTTAVAEYFASLTVSVPVGTLIDAAECLSKQIEINYARSSMPTGFDYLKEVKGGLRIAWLSDLHIAEVNSTKRPFRLKKTKLIRRLFLDRKNEWTESFASGNLATILQRVEEQEPTHVLITGDITNLALKDQFRSAREKFLAVQHRVGPRTDGLSHKFWTILPGNHDVSKSSSGEKLSLFFEAFDEAYPNGYRVQRFPVCKTIRSPAESSEFELELVGLDSTPNWPVEVVGMNARGELGGEQKDKLQELLSARHSSGKFVVVALHHAPLSVPYIKSELTEYFMSLDQADAKELIDLCCDFGVKGILHGHYHTYSPWNAPVGAPNEIVGYMPIVGAPCGTTDAPGQNVEFLELREVEVAKGAATTTGLSVVRHKLELQGLGQREQEWHEEELGVVIY